MILYNEETFFNSYKSRFGQIRPSQKEGLIFLLDKLDKSERINTTEKRAYVLATIKWETAHTFLPIAEYGSIVYLKSKKYYPYIGRGYAQLTWKENYKAFGDALGIDLVNDPDLALKKEIAWKILEMGMTDDFGMQDPNFTKYTLENFFYNNHYDFLNARKIINPKDFDSYEPIAEIAEKFNDCLRFSMIKKIAELSDPRGLETIT